MIKAVDPKAKRVTSSKSEEVKEGSEEDYKKQRMWDQHDDDTEDLGIISQGEQWGGMRRAKQRKIDKEQHKKGVKEADMGAPLTPPTVQQWAAKVKSLYPDVQFIHQKMLNGATFAMSKMAGGKVGFYDPKRGINKTVPVGAPVLEAGEELGAKKINVEAKCKVCGTPYKSHFTFNPQGDPYGKITHTLVRGICGRVPGDFPGLQGETVGEPSQQDPGASAAASMSNIQSSPSVPSKRLEVGSVIGYSNSKVLNKPSKIIKAEVLELGGMIGRSSVRVKLLDPQDIADNGGKLTAIISQFQVRQNPYVEESVNEDFEDLPNELLDPQAWKALDIRQKYKALVDAGLIKLGRFGDLSKKWMNDDGTNYPLDHTFTPDGLKDGSLDLNKIYRSAQADYQDRTHSSNITSQDRENELNIGSEGRNEVKRKADELAEMRREKLRSERLHDEETAFQRAETVQQREDEMKKIADQYKHDLTVIDKEHRNNMEAIKTNNTFELDKLDKEYKDAQREREFKGSETDKEYADAQREREFKSGESDKEFRDRNADRDFRSGESDKEFRDRNADREFRSGESDKDYADRQRERQHQQSMADKEREQSQPKEEPRPRPRPQRPRPETNARPEPAKPEPQTWHTSQQVGSNVKDDKDDIEDVEARPFTPYTPRPSKPPALNAPKREAKYDNNRTGFSRGPRDDERHDLDVPRPLIYGLKINGKIWKKDGNVVTFFTKERALAARNAILAKRPDVEVGLVQRPKD